MKSKFLTFFFFLMPQKRFEDDRYTMSRAKATVPPHSDEGPGYFLWEEYCSGD